MDREAFGLLLGQVSVLDGVQRETLCHVLSDQDPEAEVAALVDGAGGGSRACPRCRSDRIGAWGQAHDLPRYRCKACLRTFNALTGTSLARLRHKDRWLGFAAALAQAASIRKTAKACAIAIQTSFRWRHRFLAAPSCEQPALLSGIVEADETFFRRSFKGLHAWSHPGEGIIPPRPAARHRGAPTGRRGTPLDEQTPVLVMRDRQRNTGYAILPDLTAQTIGSCLKPMLAPDAVLCTDTAAVYTRIARETGIHHEPINISAGERVRDHAFHLQNVNAYDSRLKDWMHRFRGVATKYLSSYLGWRRMIEALHNTLAPASILIACSQPGGLNT
ncbi:IS1595 family transposase, partial [Acetobacter fallax]